MTSKSQINPLEEWEYNHFVNTGHVEEARLKDIAIKIANRKPALTNMEFSIAVDKMEQVKKILQQLSKK